VDSHIAARRSLAEAAALAAIDEMGAEMKTKEPRRDAQLDQERKDPTKAIWALGDYHRFAKQTVWQLGPVLVAACGIRSGQRVLDVAAGSGNVAIRAAEAGARVVASDLTPAGFGAGRLEAAERKVRLEWVEADAEALPFADAAFDVVTSCFGAMFAPDHQRVADELLRVCRPGGTVGMINFTPEGLGGEFFELFGRYAPPPPPGTLAPVLWGSEEHVRELFDEEVEQLQLERREYVERAPSARAYVRLFQDTFGPAIGIRAALADDPARAETFDRELLEFASRANREASDGSAEYHYEYLLVVARKRAPREPRS
jgi:ubiquinone/menaquinone biosynthesis C-methylase UbiE